MRTGEVEDLRHMELTRLGVPAEEAAAWVASQEPETAEEGGDTLVQAAGPLEVWPCNWPVLTLFLQVQTQWRWAPGGRPVGLAYQGVESAMRLRRLPERARLFGELVEMEHAAIEAWAD